MDFFNSLRGSGLPMPSSMPAPSEVRSRAKRLSKSIFTSWDTLHAILEKREETIRKRWMKKTKDQRAKILLAAWPNMPASHRPDFQALRKNSTSKPQGAFKWPYVNLEDLTQSRNLLLLLNSRGRNLPEAFAHADLEATHVGQTSQVVNLEFLNEYTMYLVGGKNPDTYGQLVSWDEDDNAFDLMMNQIQFPPGHGLLVLEVQDKLLRFLVECCYQMFHDIHKEKLIDDTVPSLPEPSPIVATETSYAQLSAVAAEAPYRVPAKFDIDRLKLLVESRRASAVDHIWDLREDPAYFAATALDYADHRQEKLRDTTGGRHPHDDDDLFWGRVLTTVIMDSYGEFLLFDKILEKVLAAKAEFDKLSRDLDTGKSLPTKLEEALLDLRYTLDRLVQGPILNTKLGVPASPPLRAHFERLPQQPGTSKMTVQTKRGPGGDALLTLFSQLWDSGQVFLLRLPNLVDEMQRCIDDPFQKGRISSWVAHVFSDLALLAQMMHQVDIFYPWSAAFEAKLDTSRKERQPKYMKDMEDFSQFHTIIEKCPSLAGLGTPTQGRFKYPADKRRNEAITKAIQAAERNLDVFWQKFDDYFGSAAGKSIQELQSSHGMQIRPIHRTPDWIPKASSATSGVADIDRSLSKLALSSSEPERAPGRLIAEPQKVKPKRRGTAAPEADEPTIPTPEQPPPSPAGPLFTVTKRAFKVFSSMFHMPTSTLTQERAGEVMWSDFLHAMTCIGFGAEKRYGSVWQFTPTRLDVTVGIQFHEPHPVGKISWMVARRWGARLGRNYGLSGENFTFG
ncbi:uncharacterized protein BCR38DRAFT_394731 [Pseudomassariella vexata]|uniref:Uncharacterized protein n=1 Tax=Pseudomassariella vexata TaxID=1141098 RepID=A0A1Y2DS67_9PEZI|nr:uncharacterized protein BCR38DRAFT_394731 [Pseudomassariella vexata]ORY62097.1 hypothetical protein BCR38DRAFT_394731 [Pseudomassariella vexata]